MNESQLPGAPEGRAAEPNRHKPRPVGTRKERRVARKLPVEARLSAWTQCWVSRDGKMRVVFASRTFDYAVLTDQHLYLYTTGFFTRRPRRQVYVAQLDRLHASDRQAKRGRRVRLWSREHRPLILEMRRNARSNTFTDLLLHRTIREVGDE
jgi:hypothetical protein